MLLVPLLLGRLMSIHHLLAHSVIVSLGRLLHLVDRSLLIIHHLVGIRVWLVQVVPLFVGSLSIYSSFSLLRTSSLVEWVSLSLISTFILSHLAHYDIIFESDLFIVGLGGASTLLSNRNLFFLCTGGRSLCLRLSKYKLCEFGLHDWILQQGLVLAEQGARFAGG